MPTVSSTCGTAVSTRKRQFWSKSGSLSLSLEILRMNPLNCASDYLIGCQAGKLHAGKKLFRDTN